MSKNVPLETRISDDSEAESEHDHEFNDNIEEEGDDLCK